MTNYYACERKKGADRMAASKARTDVEEILESKGYVFLNIDQSIDLDPSSTIREKLARRSKAVSEWETALSVLNNGDVLVVQLPIRNHSIGVAKLLAGLPKRGIRVIYILHDLESIRTVKDRAFNYVRRSELSLEEKTMVKGASALIVHNDAMKERVTSIFGVDMVNRCISLKCFDYMADGNPCEGKCHRKTDPVVIAGNLDKAKAGYAYALPNAPQFNLYGVNWKGVETANVCYQGSYPADEIPQVLNGSFGLVWDGPSRESCEGIYGEYLRVNNPHKTSLYLTSGLPIIIWDQAAMAKFVLDNHVGLTVSSLSEIEHGIDSLTEKEYQEMCLNAAKLSAELRSGAFLDRALNKALSIS